MLHHCERTAYRKGAAVCLHQAQSAMEELPDDLPLENLALGQPKKVIAPACLHAHSDTAACALLHRHMRLLAERKSVYSNPHALSETEEGKSVCLPLCMHVEAAVCVLQDTQTPKKKVQELNY